MPPEAQEIAESLPPLFIEEDGEGSTEPEAKEPAPPAEPAPQETISRKAAYLLKKEQEFQAKARAEKESIRVARESYERDKAEIDSLKAKYEKIKKDPIEGLKEAGLNYDELTKNILNQDTPEWHIAQLREELTALRTEREQEKQQIQQTVAQKQIEESKSAYEQFVFQNEEQYPYLTLHEPAEVRDALWNVAVQYYQKTGVAPDQDELAQFLESQTKSRYDQLEERRAKRTAPKESQDEKAPSSTPSKQAKVASTRTLTNGKAAERSTPALPSDISKLSPDRQKEVYAEYLAKHLWRD